MQEGLETLRHDVETVPDKSRTFARCRLARADATYNDLAARGKTAVGRIRRQEPAQKVPEARRTPREATTKGVPMTTAQDVMHLGAECIGETESLAVAAQKMRELGVGALPICGQDDRLHGIITDRDIVVKCVAQGRDPAQVRAGDLAQEKLVWVEATADVREALTRMEEHRIKWLPVIDNHRLVGMISEADLARNLGEQRTGRVRGEGVRHGLTGTRRNREGHPAGAALPAPRAGAVQHRESEGGIVAHTADRIRKALTDTTPL
jgi:CBS domain-containing protein